MRTPPIGCHSVNPFVIARDAAALMAFLAGTFGGVERERISRDDGSIGHAEVQIGDSVVMLTDATGELPSRPSAFYLYVDDVDDAFDRALRHGATARSEPADRFYGNREAGVTDPWGNIWWAATVIEEARPTDTEGQHGAQG